MTGVVAFGGWLAFVLARLETWAGGHISLFIMSGQVAYSHPAQMPPGILHVPLEGYDGQFYYRLALDPFNWHQTAYGITMDHNYRYTRIGYPLVTWIISAGQHGFVPVALVVVNLACVAAMGVLGGMIARDSGRHALWGLLLVAYFGLVISVGRDMIEPLADACMLGGLLAFRRSRHVLAAVLLTCAVITNEPVLAFAAAIAVVRLYAMCRRRARPGRQDLAWLLPGLAVVVLQVIEHFAVLGGPGGLSDIKNNFYWPFAAMVAGVYDDIRQLSWAHATYDYNLIVFLALAVFVVAGLRVLRSTTAPVHERIAFIFFILVEMVLASGQIWTSTFADGRVYIDVYLLAVVMLLGTPRAAGSPEGAAASRGAIITNKHLGRAAAIAAAVLIVIAQRHIVSQ